MKFAFISRHQPTDSQHAMAAMQGHSLIYIGDTDAFSIDADFVRGHGQFDGVVAVHPVAALRLAPQFVIGVFENTNRAPVGAPPKFEAVSFRIYGLRD